MAEDWTHVRVRRSTHAALKRLAERIDSARVRGHAGLQDLDDVLTVDEVIVKLVRLWERHQERKKESERRRAARRRGPLVHEGRHKTNG